MPAAAGHLPEHSPSRDGATVSEASDITAPGD